MRKEVISTEWDRRKERKEKAEEKVLRKANEKVKAKQDKKNKFLIVNSKRLKNDLPKSEQWFLSYLKKSGLSRYFSSNVVLNNMIPDFVDYKKRIVIEIDGSIHWNNANQLERDRIKDSNYLALGYTVYRINHKDETKAKEVIGQLSTLYGII
jgi:very-short-patch-repair endonuclease